MAFPSLGKGINEGRKEEEKELAEGGKECRKEVMKEERELWKRRKGERKGFPKENRLLLVNESNNLIRGKELSFHQKEKDVFRHKYHLASLLLTL